MNECIFNAESSVSNISAIGHKTGDHFEVANEVVKATQPEDVLRSSCSLSHFNFMNSRSPICQGAKLNPRAPPRADLHDLANA